MLTAMSHHSAPNGKNFYGGDTFGGQDVEKGLLRLIAADSAGLQVGNSTFLSSFNGCNGHYLCFVVHVLTRELLVFLIASRYRLLCFFYEQHDVCPLEVHEM